MFFREYFVYFGEFELEVLLFFLREDVVEDSLHVLDCGFRVLQPRGKVEVHSTVGELLVLLSRKLVKWAFDLLED